MKNRLHKLIALGIVTVLSAGTAVFAPQEMISGVVTTAAATELEEGMIPLETPEDGSEDETEKESEAEAGDESVEDEGEQSAEVTDEAAAAEGPAGDDAAEPANDGAEGSAAEPANDGDEGLTEEPAGDDAAEPASAESLSDEEPASAESLPDEEPVSEESLPDEEPAEDDAGIVSSDWERVTADVGAVGDELILDVGSDETEPDTAEPFIADPVEEAADVQEPEEETEQEETEAEEEAEEDEEAAANIIGFSVDPSQYPAADASANTRYIYNYLTKTMGFNHAAACGILANIQMESAFNPLALGDGGTSYGLCQWHNERFNSLISYCNSVGLDYNTLDGQLANLNRELTGAYSSIYSYIMSVPDTAQGAYDAGYYWCVYFEIPNNAASHGALRGNLASNEYYPLDLSMDDSEEMPVEESIFRLREDMALQSKGWAVNTEEDGSVIFSFPEVVLIKKNE